MSVADYTKVIWNFITIKSFLNQFEKVSKSLIRKKYDWTKFTHSRSIFLTIN